MTTNLKQLKDILTVLEDRSTCLSRKVGAIITDKYDNIIGVGYNGAPNFLKSCADKKVCIRKQHNIKSGECLDMCRAVHAEERALIDCNKKDKIYKLYVSCMPCSRCAKLLIDNGVREIIAYGEYNSEYTKQLLDEANVRYKVIKHD